MKFLLPAYAAVRTFVYESENNGLIGVFHPQSSGMITFSGWFSSWCSEKLFVHRCQASSACTLGDGVSKLQTSICNLSRGSAKLFTCWKWCAKCYLTVILTEPSFSSLVLHCLEHIEISQMTVCWIVKQGRKQLPMFPSCPGQLSVSPTVHKIYNSYQWLVVIHICVGLSRCMQSVVRFPYWWERMAFRANFYNISFRIKIVYSIKDKQSSCLWNRPKLPYTLLCLCSSIVYLLLMY